MSTEEYDMHFDEDMLHQITCKYCGLDKLRWERTNVGWRLYDSNDTLHLCRHHTDEPHSPQEHHHEHHD